MRKQTHTRVNYRPRSNFSARFCANCASFIDRYPAACSHVESPIYSGGVCNIWTRAGSPMEKKLTTNTNQTNKEDTEKKP